jgi:hypothetical protein
MRQIAWAVLISAILVVGACDSPEQPPAKPPSVAAAPVSPAAKPSTLPEVIVLDASQGQVTLPHLAHATRLICATCHSEIEPGKIAWDKTTVHSYCHDCHIGEGAGPTTCLGCHRK